MLCSSRCSRSVSSPAAPDSCAQRIEGRMHILMMHASISLHQTICSLSAASSSGAHPCCPHRLTLPRGDASLVSTYTSSPTGAAMRHTGHAMRWLACSNRQEQRVRWGQQGGQVVASARLENTHAHAAGLQMMCITRTCGMAGRRSCSTTLQRQHSRWAQGSMTCTGGGKGSSSQLWPHTSKESVEC